MWKDADQPLPPSEPILPGYDRDNHPAGLGLGHREGPDPSWGDVIGGIWDRLTNPLPGSQ